MSPQQTAVPQSRSLSRNAHLGSGTEADRINRINSSGVVNSNTKMPEFSALDSAHDAGSTALQRCVHAELSKYFAMLEGQPPRDLYRLVMSQVESAVIDHVLDVCGNNQSRAASYLGISRGKLRSKVEELSLGQCTDE